MMKVWLVFSLIVSAVNTKNIPCEDFISGDPLSACSKSTLASSLQISRAQLIG